MSSFRELLGKRILFFDGAMGTMLQNAGLKSGELPDLMNLSDPALIGGIHAKYLDAGCNVVTTNTFGANRLKLKDKVGEVISAAIGIARKETSKYENAFVAQDIGPTGKLLAPFGDLAFEKAVELFAEQVRAGEDKADLILIETMSDLYEAKAAILAAKENSSLPVVVTMIFGSGGRLLTGADAANAAVTLAGLGVDALGINCGFGPEAMLPLVEQMAAATDLPILVSPNAGLPEVVDGRTVFNVEPEEFASYMVKIVNAGACCIGGCCGTTPDHIRAEIEACRDLPLVKTERETPTAVTSYSKRVEFGERTVIIGERINPTGKKRFKQALRENDLDYIIDEGIDQADTGADILDVNVGLPEIDEKQMLTDVVKELQTVVSLPLQLDTTNTQALEEALRVYNGKAMINSVNGKKETTDAVFPLVKKYGGVTVCLLLDEEGIPASSEGRLAIADRILKRAAEFGIPARELVFDPLAMAVSTDPNAARITLETVHKLHKKGLKTVLGVSNVSFGLPDRELLTSEFFVLAMQAGLSAGIVNPKSERVMNACRAFNALSGRDENFADYIGTRSAAEVKTSADAEKKTLFDCILKGLSEEARTGALELLKTKDALEIIDSDIIPALNEAGRRFEEKSLFLPQLLMCAEAAKTVFGVIKESIPREDAVSKGKILICTVKNDVHDIGKNIVKTLLENYGYEVIDLGKDVAPETVAREVVSRSIRLVGLSALMTTTVPFMEQTVKAVRAAAPDCRIMVGGAVLTQKYADMIGADSYSRDAMGAVRYAEEVFSVK
ncbi:MAG: homocysteine S-methyltransferase family protein [Clostridia bacterium]|nr:homocysteine S-methyltransferase family protein [Clostridia bacterium]